MQKLPLPLFVHIRRYIALWLVVLLSTLPMIVPVFKVSFANDIVRANAAEMSVKNSVNTSVIALNGTEYGYIRPVGLEVLDNRAAAGDSLAAKRIIASSRGDFFLALLVIIRVGDSPSNNPCLNRKENNQYHEDI